jgi:LAO/AO transport system kinase
LYKDEVNLHSFTDTAGNQSIMEDGLLQLALQGDRKSIARCISLIENRVPGWEQAVDFLSAPAPAPLIGITGPPGAGKSTLVDALVGVYVQEGKQVAVVCVDPSSPFTHGALLGDRIRMSHWYNHPAVYIRSLASRGALGGLHETVAPITTLLRHCGFDLVLLETVGVGQSEVGIAAVADISMVVLVPEAGDEIQFMKAGLMEVADIFVVNKSDRDGADQFAAQLRNMLHQSSHPKHERAPVVVNTIASNGVGIVELKNTVNNMLLTRQPEQYPTP